MAVDVSERVMVFIDGSAMYFGLKENLGGRSDIRYDDFVESLAAGRKFVRAYYYNSRADQGSDPTRYRNQMKFYGTVEVLPYFACRYGRLLPRDVKLRCRNCRKKFKVDNVNCPHCNAPHSCTIEVQKGVDVKIAADLLIHAFKDHYDTAILLTGDGDLAEAVEEVTKEGKHVENAFFQKGSSPHLRKSCDVFTELLPSSVMPFMGAITP